MNAEGPNRGRTLALVGLALQVGPIIGMLVTVIGMMHSFDKLAATGVSDPRLLAGNIGEVLIFTAIGLGIGLIGLVFAGVALLACGYRARWFFWFLVIYGVILLLAFPVGSVIGIFVLYACLTRRQEFRVPDIKST